MRTGLCEPNLPFGDCPLPPAITTLERRFEHARRLYDEGKNSEWQDQAEEILGRVRQAWELAIEEALLPVMQRFAEKVHTRGLRQVAVLTQDDCVLVDEARERCSRLQHRPSAAASTPPPTPDDVDREIQALKRWDADVKSRQRKANVS